MSISRTLATWAVSLLSLGAVAVGAAPAGASPAVSETASSPVAAAACTGWKNAGSVPLKWTSISDGCGHFGARGMKMGYGWTVTKGGSVCVKVKGFNAQGQKTWYDAGCGKSGSLKVSWGNVAGEKEIMFKGGPSLVRWN